MIVEFTGQTNPVCLTNGERYPVVSLECGWYRIVDSSDEDYLYPSDLFRIIDPYPTPPEVQPSPRPIDF